ncbi:hypothetical protein ACTFIW_008836, partial [Dictyostelium discoideum]
VKKLMVI